MRTTARKCAEFTGCVVFDEGGPQLGRVASAVPITIPPERKDKRTTPDHAMAAPARRAMRRSPRHHPVMFLMLESSYGVWPPRLSTRA
ncbi:hypothetical protein THIOKS12550018 [Thiocapsa sp. KS1]|nr:hypothetical protein THIOKS12550018 [Thiocapsa sp. KS1]